MKFFLVGGVRIVYIRINRINILNVVKNYVDLIKWILVGSSPRLMTSLVK